MKQFISRRSFMKAAGAATALTAVSFAAPAASAEETNCFLGDKSAVTILYTNDVHTYIDKKSPELTYAAIAALKKATRMRARTSCSWTPVTTFRAPPMAPWTMARPSSS